MSTDELREQFDTTLRRERIVAIVRAASATEAVAAGEQLVDQGIRVLEVSLNTPEAVVAIRTLSTAVSARGFVGGGTALDANDVHRLADAGARFFVSPVLDPAAIAAADERGLLAIPGCATPTEMREAHRVGAYAVKQFTATWWTPAGLANVLRAMPFLRVIPTGGIDPDNATQWLTAGATALGIGSALTDSPEAASRLRTTIGDMLLARSS
jgi:2-dehydro-3-deoxyphosphogluconate aldolase / (4S)-4-hydroxy-2-oxoglutarate aldolase